MGDLQCEPEHINDRIIFMSMHNDIAWGEKGNQKDVNEIHRQLRSLVFLGVDQKRNGIERTPTKLQRT